MTLSACPNSSPASPRRHGTAAARAVFALFAAFALSACGASGVTRGADLYADGHHIEAAEVFEHTEARLAELDAEERARYGLYRGAALLSLGDVPRASRWLEYSKRRSDALSADERKMLVRALGVAATQRVPERVAERSLMAGTPAALAVP